MEPGDLKVIEERINALRELIEMRFTLFDKALELQAEEYARRLSDLNGEAGRLREERALFLPREVYQTFVEETRKWREITTTTLASMGGQERGVDKTWTTVIALVSAALSAAVTYVTTHRW